MGGYEGAGDGRGAGAAIGLQHVAVQVDGEFAQRGQIEHRAHRAADQALDFLGAPGLLAAGGFTVRARVGGARQHAVLGGDPAFATALLVGWHLGQHAGGAQHLGVAKGTQDSTFGVTGVVAGQSNRAQRIGCASAGSHVGVFSEIDSGPGF